jgi:hypothetical protein
MAEDTSANDETTKDAPWSDSDKTYYAATISLINGSEATTWSRLTSFAFLSGFLANAISSEAMPALSKAGFAVFGFWMSMAYIALMVRSRKFVDAYVEIARTLEARHPGVSPMVKAKIDGVLRAGVLAPTIPYFAAVFFSHAYTDQPKIHPWGWSTVPYDVMSIAQAILLGIVPLIGLINLIRGVRRSGRLADAPASPFAAAPSPRGASSLSLAVPPATPAARPPTQSDS